MKKLIFAFLFLYVPCAAPQVLCPSGYNFNGVCIDNPKGTTTFKGQDGTGTGGAGGSILWAPGAPVSPSTAVGTFTIQMDPTNPAVNFQCTNPTVGGVNTASCSFNGMAGIPLANLANTYSAASVLRARDYGVLTANTAIQNDTAFLTLKTAMQASSTTVWRVIFEPGTYHYTNNRWIFNVQNFICECYGVTFQNDSASAANIDGYPLNNREMFDDSGDVAGIASVFVNGDLINTAAAGALTVTTTTAGNAAHFAAGNRVMIYGYDQQESGYPPNMRYFEEKLVTGVNAGTGVVTLSNQLQNSYDSRWWDTANYAGTGVTYGAPRILNLDRTNYKRPKLIWIRGATLPANSITPASLYIQITADLLILEDVTGVGLNLSETDQAYCIRCKMVGNQSNGDKLVDRMVIADSIIDSNPGFATALSDCVGVNDLIIERSKFFGAINQCAPRHLIVQNTDIVPASSAVQGIGTASTNPVRSVVVGSTRIFNTGGLNNGYTNVNPASTFVIGSVTGTTIKMTWNAAAMTVANNIEYGMSLYDVTQNCTAVVTGIFLTGGNTLNITQTGCAAPVAGDTVSYYDVMNLTDDGGNVIVGTQVPFFRGPPGPTITTGPVISGNPLVADTLSFYTPTTTATNKITFQDVSYGLQIVSNGGAANIGYFTGSSFNMNAGSTLNAATFSANGPTVLDENQGANTTRIGTGTTTGLVSIGGGSDGVVINSNQSGSIKDPALISSGTKFTTTGCSISSTTGGAAAGTFTLGANSCTAVITINGATGLTSNTGWSCQAHDRTAPAVLIGGESSSTATTASFTIPAGAGATDVISYSCTGY